MNIAQIGEPGTGKTRNLLTLLPLVKKTNKPIAVVDVDGKLPDTPKFLLPISEGLFDVFAVPSRQVEGGLRKQVMQMKTAPSQEPKGYYAIVDAVDKIKANESDYCAVVLDTLTVSQEHLRHLLQHVGRVRKFEFEQWALMLENLEILFTSFYDINVPIKIINMHEKTDKDENTGIVRVLPHIDGGFVNKAGIYVSEFYRCTARETSKGNVQYFWRTRPDGRFNARSDVFEEVEVLQSWEPVCRSLNLL